MVKIGKIKIGNSLFVLLLFIMTCLGLFATLIVCQIIHEKKFKHQHYLDCVAGCGSICSNDLRRNLGEQTPEEQIETLADYGFLTEEEIQEGVKSCKERYPNFDKPLYPYTEIRQ